MPTDKKEWRLQIYWQGGWRTIMDSDNRKELVEYARSCPEDLQLRILNKNEEEVKARGRRH